MLLWVARSGLPHNILRIFALVLTKNMRRLHSTYVLSVVKDRVHYILNIKIEYFVCRFLGHVVLIVLLDVRIYENILLLTSI